MRERKKKEIIEFVLFYKTIKMRGRNKIFQPSI
jgi:hypothetical protein